jgi:hypothetical protein
MTSVYSLSLPVLDRMEGSETERSILLIFSGSTTVLNHEIVGRDCCRVGKSSLPADHECNRSTTAQLNHDLCRETGPRTAAIWALGTNAIAGICIRPCRRRRAGTWIYVAHQQRAAGRGRRAGKKATAGRKTRGSRRRCS